MRISNIACFFTFLKKRIILYRTILYIVQNHARYWRFPEFYPKILKIKILLKIMHEIEWTCTLADF